MLTSLHDLSGYSSHNTGSTIHEASALYYDTKRYMQISACEPMTTGNLSSRRQLLRSRNVDQAPVNPPRTHSPNRFLPIYQALMSKYSSP
jgi:hypothetical protein